MGLSAPVRPALDRRLAEAADLVTVALDELLPRGEGGEGRLTEAMRYAVLGPGRRLRPFFVLEAARLFDAEERSVLRAACAIECVHAASIVHEDLTLPTDARQRRARAAVHRQYDEPTAVLAGDALQAAAFEILAHPDTHEDGEVRAALVYRLARAAGAKGLAGGRMIGRVGVGEDPGQAVRMQRMKTGALISFAFEVPLVIVRPPEARRQALRSFGQDLGFAYRLAEDLSDLPAKPPARPSEPVAPSTRAPAGEPAERVALLSAQCKAHLDIFGAKADYLRECVDFVLDRRI